MFAMVYVVSYYASSFRATVVLSHEVISCTESTPYIKYELYKDILAALKYFFE